MGVCSSFNKNEIKISNTKEKKSKTKKNKNNEKNKKNKNIKKNSSSIQSSNTNINNNNSNINYINNNIKIITINNSNKVLLNSKEKNLNTIKTSSDRKRINTSNSIINNDDEVDEINNEQLNINNNKLNENMNNNKINSNSEYEKNNILTNSIIYDKNKFDIENKSFLIKTTKNKIDIIIPATIGEVEYPIYFQTNDEIIIEVNDMSETWEFLSEYGKTNIKGYDDIKYNNKNLGCLFLRIAGTKELININEKINYIKCIKDRNIFFSANLNPNDYSEYEPEGEIHLTIKLNNKNNEIKYLIKHLVSEDDKINNKLELEIIYYINYIRTKPKEFLNNYLYYLNKDDKLYKLLNEFSSLPPLKKNNILSKFAIKTCRKICMDGTTGIDYTNLKTQINEKGLELKQLAINSLYGIKNSLFIVIKMLLDKYNKNNQNKFNILFPDYNIIGVSLKKHISYRYACIIIFGEK